MSKITNYSFSSGLALGNLEIGLTSKIMFSITLISPSEFSETNGVGVGNRSVSLGITNFLGGDANGIAAYDTGSVWNDGNPLSGQGTDNFNSAFSIIDVAIDRGNNLIWWRVNGGYWNSNSGEYTDGDPETGTRGIDISSITGTLYPGVSLYTGTMFEINRESFYSIPAGYVFEGDWEWDRDYASENIIILLPVEVQSFLASGRYYTVNAQTISELRQNMQYLEGVDPDIMKFDIPEWQPLSIYQDLNLNEFTPTVLGNVALLPGDKVMFSITQDSYGDIINWSAIGVAKSSVNLLPNQTEDGWLGYYSDSAALYDAGVVFINSNTDGFVNVGEPLFFENDGDIIDVAVDRVNDLIWWRVNGGYWNGDETANPEQSLGGFSIRSLGTDLLYFAAIPIYTGQYTINTDVIYDLPAGFKFVGNSDNPWHWDLNKAGYGINSLLDPLEDQRIYSSNKISTLPTKEQKQKFKLDLAQSKRRRKFGSWYRDLNIYDIELLPTRYEGNIVVPNSHPLGLTDGRPWVINTGSGAVSVVSDGLLLFLNALDISSYPGSGNIWRDISGNANDFSAFGNAPTFTPGLGFTGFNYETGDFWYRSTFPLNIKQSPQGYTTLVWARCDGASTGGEGYGRIIGNGDSDNYIDLWQYDGIDTTYYREDGSTLFYNKNIIVDSGALKINDSQWRMLGSSGQDSDANNPIYSFAIGNDPFYWDYYPFNGYIAMVLIYNKILTEEEIIQNYNAMKYLFAYPLLMNGEDILVTEDGSIIVV